ncbi:MAG: hypothetical protein R2726_21070 [Acidimicrobiales bacterium]
MFVPQASLRASSNGLANVWSPVWEQAQHDAHEDGQVGVVGGDDLVADAQLWVLDSGAVAGCS